jgi:hypothetical protein
MERVLVWDRVRNRIPDGVYYNRQSIPYKSDGYDIVIDTGYVFSDIVVDVNGEVFYGKTDGGGLCNLHVKLNLGVNKIRYRLWNEIGYKDFEIETTNEAILSYGIAEAGKSELEILKEVLYDSFSETATSMHRFKYLLDYDEIDSRYKYGEVLEAYKQWIDRYRAIRILGNVVDSGVSGFIGKLRSWLCGANIVKGWKYESLNGFYLNMFYGGNLSIVNDIALFGRVLQYQGSGLGRIYAECGYYDDNLISDWVITVFLKSNVTINGAKVGIGYRDENRFIEFNISAITTTWKSYTFSVAEDKVPDVAFIQLPGIGVGNNWVRIGLWRVKRGRWANSLKVITGSFRPVKSSGVYIGHSSDYTSKKDLIERVLPVWVKPNFVYGNIKGYWGDSLGSCVLYNCYYDSDKKAVINKQIYRYDTNLEYISSDVARFGAYATRNWGLLKKNNNVIIKDSGELGVLSWDWYSDDAIKIYNGYFEYMEEWKFSYEVLTAVVTGVIDIGTVSSEYDVIVDGLVEYGLSGLAKDRLVKEVVTFDVNGIGVLRNNALIDEGVSVVDLRTGKSVKAEFISKTTIRLSEVIDIGIVSYYVRGLILDRDYKLWWKGSNSLSQMGSAEWQEVRFLDIVPIRRYNQLKLVLYGEKPEDFYRVKGLYLRLSKEVEA